uniref:Uncharacterized protein n=1 Tax=Panagrolaimus davidi TaxID=227884 RepID=A0A914PIJ5_9BILA
MDSSREYRTFKFISTVIAQSLAISTSLILAYLVKKHSSKLLSALINYPIVYLIPEGILGNLSPTASHIGLVLVGFFMNFNVAILPVQYIYRYILICYRKSITLKYFILLCFTASLLPLAIVYGYVTACWPDSYFSLYVQFLNKPEWLLSNGKIPGFVACRLLELEFTNLLNNILFIIVYVIIIFCSFKVILNLRQLKRTTTKNSQKMQTQITLILLVQALIPLIIQVFPQVAGNIASKMSPESFAYFNIAMMILTAWAPLTYPICTIFIIGSYRGALFKYCRYLVGKKSPAKSTTVIVTAFSKMGAGSY